MVDLVAYPLPERLITQVVHGLWSEESYHPPIWLRQLPIETQSHPQRTAYQRCIHTATLIFSEIFLDLISELQTVETTIKIQANYDKLAQIATTL